MRLDACRLLHHTRRPMPLGVRGSGFGAAAGHSAAAYAIAALGVAVHVGVLLLHSTALTARLPLTVLSWTMEQPPSLFGALFVCEHVLLAVVYLTHTLVPDTPPEVSIAAARLRWKADLALAVYSDTPPTPPSFWEDALADLDNGAASGGPEGAVPCRMPPHASQRHAMV